MYFNDHNPPHFHVRYEETRAVIGIDPLEIREGFSCLHGPSGW
jgi:hypothetical protein